MWTIPCNFFTQVNGRSPISLKFWQSIFVNRKKVSNQNFSSKKNYLAFLRLFYFSLPFYSNKNFFLHVLLRKAQIDRKKFSKKYIIDVKFLKESIPDVRLATRGFPNLKMPRNRFFFIIRYLISRIFVIFFTHVKTFVFSLFSSPNTLKKI